MAISYLNSQGVMVYIVSPSLGETTPTPALILAGDAVVCPQSIGSLEQTRPVTEYRCLSTEDSAKSVGSIGRGSIELGLLFDPTDTAGQDALATAFANNDEITVGIELSDRDTTVGPTGVSGTIFAFNAFVSAISVGIEQDAAVTYTVTVEIASAITELAAVAGTA